jgi:hypothetical protein
MDTKTETKTPFIDNLALKLARLYYRKDRAQAREIWRLAERHVNTALLCEDFLDANTIVPGSTSPWEIAFINGSGIVKRPPFGEAGNVVVENSHLKLQVRRDPKFDQKSAKWVKGAAAAEKYNNAYVVGMGGFMPTPRQSILIQCRMKISAGFHGSTGIWVQEAKTFDPNTGIMVKPFRSFGFSYLGEASDAYIRGLAVETVLGLSVQDKLTVSDIDVTVWHVYEVKWAWLKPDAQRVDFRIDDRAVGYFQMHPFGPGEIQLWADNYQIGRGLKIGFLNVPVSDETVYDWLRISAIPV